MKKIFIILMILLFTVGTSAQQRVFRRSAIGTNRITLNPVSNPTKDTLSVLGSGTNVDAETIIVDLTSQYLELKGFIGFGVKYDTIPANFPSLQDSASNCDGVLPAIRVKWALLNPYKFPSISTPLATVNLDSLMLYTTATSTIWNEIEDSLLIHDRWIYFDLTDSIPFTHGLMIVIEPNEDSIASTVVAVIDTFRRLNLEYDLIFR